MLKNFFIIFILAVLFSSCAGLPAMQSRIRRAAAKGDFQYAADFISQAPAGSYGKNNRLIEALDRGMVFHYAGRYRDSIKSFEEAKKVYDDLYTRSLSKMTASWLWNDAALPYPGEDFERVMINVFQALNFVALGEFDAALVEARNASAVLQTINSRYSDDQQNQYRDDAFVRMLAGILYEALGERQDLNHAFIDYKKSLGIYETVYQPAFNIAVPDVLKENLLSVAEWMGREERRFYLEQFPDVPVYSLKERAQKAELYVVLYRGQIVNKVQGTIVLPGMDGLLTRISFPKYRKSFRSSKDIPVNVVSDQGGEQQKMLTPAQNLDAIARQNLENRRMRILAKAVARPLTKQLMVEAAGDYVNNSAGKVSEDIFNIAGNFYLLYSEQADTRAWETLPAELYLGRFILEQGDYELVVHGKSMGKMRLDAGQKKFITHWLGY